MLKSWPTLLKTRKNVKILKGNAVSNEKFDLKMMGHQIRHHRKAQGLTLIALGKTINRPASYLSQLENGHLEPKLGVLANLASALNCSTTDLLSAAPPNPRAALEVELHHFQNSAWRDELSLPELRPGATMTTEVLQALVGLYRALPSQPISRTGLARQEAGDRARSANLSLRTEMRSTNNYYPHIETEAAACLEAVGYNGQGPPSEKNITDLAAHYGFTIDRVKGMPVTARSVTDTRRRVIYIPQRDDLSVRSARSVVLQTLGHFALKHADTTDFEDYLRQRIESNYFAAAVLVPQAAALAFLNVSKENGDLSIEDLKERYYVSYEMAAHRFTNLATSQLGVPVHFLRTDPEGTITKAYENDGMEFPADADGALEGERVGRHWGARQVWASSDVLHYQYTATDAGEFWCVTYVENATERTPYAVTLGCKSGDAHWFRGSETVRRLSARSQDVAANPEMIKRWESIAWPSAAERSFVLTALPPASRDFTPFPGVDVIDIYRFLDRQRPGR